MKESKTYLRLIELRKKINSDRKLAKMIGISRSTLYKRLDKKAGFKNIEVMSISNLYNRVFDKNVGRGSSLKTYAQLTESEKQSILSDFLNKDNNIITEIAERHFVGYQTVNKIIDEHFKTKK